MISGHPKSTGIPQVDGFSTGSSGYIYIYIYLFIYLFLYTYGSFDDEIKY